MNRGCRVSPARAGAGVARAGEGDALATADLVGEIANVARAQALSSRLMVASRARWVAATQMLSKCGLLLAASRPTP